MRDFRQIVVWEKAHLLTLMVYKATSAFPVAEKFALSSQIRRAAASIPANIAEGCGHDSSAELLRYLRISMASGSELDYHLLLARDLGFISPDAYTPLSDAVAEIKRMLRAFITTVASSRAAARPANH